MGPLTLSQQKPELRDSFYQLGTPNEEDTHFITMLSGQEKLKGEVTRTGMLLQHVSATPNQM